MISIVIPLYNKEDSILNTVNSVLNQSYQNFEIIIVDDESKDNSLEIVKAINDDRVKIINKKNGGVSSARNEGVKSSKYNYIAFLDGDDIWLPWHLEIIHRMITRHDDLMIGGYVTKFIKSNNLDVAALSYNEIDDNDLVIDNYIKEASVRSGIISSSNFAVKKECFEQLGLYDENLSYGEDVELWYRFFKKYKLVANNSLSALYFTGAENRSDKKVFPITKRFHKFDFKNKPGYEKKYLGKLVSIIILDYSMQGAYKICFSIFWKYKRQSLYIFSYFIKLIKKKIKSFI